MKKFILFLCALMFSSFVSAADISNSEQSDINKYKSIPKKDWEEYQKYKQEQENNVFISEEEYEEYKQYKKQISNEEKEINEENKEVKKDNSINSSNENKNISNSLFVALDKTLKYDVDVKINGGTGSASDSNGWGITLEYGHRENGVMLGAGINLNNVDSSNITNIYPYINFIIPLSDKNKETVVNLFLGGAIGYGHYSEKSYIYDIEISEKGTLFWKLLCGININNLMFFINYSTNYINIEARNYYGQKISGSETYEKFSIGMGYRFIL